VLWDLQKLLFLKTTSLIEWVYQSVCSTLGTLDEKDKALVRRRLFLLACNGMDEPEVLSAPLIDSFRRSMGRAA
jgi:hypothetical protein